MTSHPSLEVSQGPAYTPGEGIVQAMNAGWGPLPPWGLMEVVVLAPDL